MKTTFPHSGSTKAVELGKTLSKGGITLSDNQPAFKKKCKE
jgi:hypothetical protein